DGYFAIDLIGVSGQIRRIFGGIEDAYRHASHIAKSRRIPARMHAFARGLAIGLRRFEHAAIAVDGFDELHRLTAGVFPDCVEGADEQADKNISRVNAIANIDTSRYKREPTAGRD